MRTLLALSYGDRRAFVNAVRMLRRTPGRLAMWALYGAVIVGFAWLKTAPRTQAAGPPRPLAIALSDLWVCGFAIALGVVLATGTPRWLGVFSSRAEALLLPRAAASPLAIATYLQARAVLLALVNGFARFAYFIVFGIPAGTTAWALAAQLMFFAAAGAAVAGVALPRALARGYARAAAVAAGCAIAAAGALPLAADALRLIRLPQAAALARYAPTVHPGAVLGALAARDLRAVALPLAIVLIATVAFVVAGRDAFPELYAISLANLEWRVRVRAPRDRAAASGRTAGRVRAMRSAARSRLRGALALVWVDSLMFARTVSPVVTALVAATALAAGAGCAAFAQRDPELAFGILAGAGPGLAVAVASATGVRLAPALRMPLFWLGDAPLAARLGAWLCGAVLRDAVVIALGAAGFAAVARNAGTALLAFAGATGLLVLTRAVGLAVFALLPNRLDQRGPAVMVRALFSFALVTPPLLAGGVAVAAGGAIAYGVLAGTAVALAEASALVVFAASRLAGRVDALTLA